MVLFYASKKHRISHTDIYYLEAEDTHWIYTRPYDTDIALVYYIRVPMNSPEYQSAFNNHYYYNNNDTTNAAMPNIKNTDTK